MKKAFIKFQALYFVLLSLVASSCETNQEFSSTQITSNSIEQTVYNNPVYNVDFPDPSIIKGDDGYFYCYGTSGTQNYGGSVGYKYLGIPIIKSKNLIDWECVGGVFPNKALIPSWGTLGANPWAPDVVKIGSQYICYYSLSKWSDPNPGIGIATATNPAGPWVDKGKLFLSSEIGVGNSIDPCCVIDEGHVYLFWGSFKGNYVIELSSDGLSIKEGAEKQLVAGYASKNWDGALYEGIYIRKLDDLYYMFLSTGTCCEGLSSTYRVVCGISENILGPYIDDNDTPLVGYENRGAGTLVIQGNEEFVGPGHMSLIQDDIGDYYMFYHSYNKKTNGNGRRLMMQKLLLNDGFAHVENYHPKAICDKPTINN